MESLWRQTADIPRRDSLAGSLKVEAAVIGAGMAGVLTAYELGRRGVRTVVLEASTIGSGQTGRTTAKITAQHGLIYSRLIQLFGEGKARQYAQANQRAVEDYRRLIRELGIECDFMELPAYLYSQTQSAPLQQEAAACQKLGLAAAFTTKTSLPFPVTGAVRMERQAQFHPLKFLAALSQRVEIFEHTPVQAVEGGRLVTHRGTVQAEHVIFTTHYPFVNMPGFYFVRMHQERSYVTALEGAMELDGLYYGVDPGGLSLRPWNSLLLLGGGAHRTGENSKGDRYAELEERGKELWPRCRVVSRWSAQDCMTLDGVPYIGRFSPTRPQWYVASGFKKWGMSSSMAAARILADQVCGKEDPAAAVFSPRRFSLTAAGAMVLEGGQAAKGLLRSGFYRPGRSLEELPPGHGGIVLDRGKKVGAYKDLEGKIHTVSPYCRHLGCQLEWNPDERSWDCPCHGSRFDVDGRLIDNPAQQGLKRPPVE